MRLHHYLGTRSEAEWGRNLQVACGVQEFVKNSLWLWFRVNNFHSPFSPFFCSSNRSLIFSTRDGVARACAKVRGEEVMVKHKTSFKVNAYAFLNRFLWNVLRGRWISWVCAHSIPRHPAYRLHNVQFAIAAVRQQSSFWELGKLAMARCISTVNGSRRFGTISHHRCSAITLAITGASAASAAEIKRGSIGRKRPRKVAMSCK